MFALKTVSKIPGCNLMHKGPFTTNESECKSEKDQRTSDKDQRINGKYQRKILLSHSLLLGLNTA